MRQLQCLLYNNNCYKSGGYINPTHIVLHTTGANNNELRRYVNPHIGQTTGMAEYNPNKTYTYDQMMSLLGKNQYNNHWNMGGLGVCVHAFIGKLADGSIATVQTLPWKMRPWGCGSGANGSYNDFAVQFEICEDDHKSKSYCKATYKEAAELCAMLCKTYNIPVDNIVSHHEAYQRGYGSGHIDPDNWWPKFGLSMDSFRNTVRGLLGQSVAAKPVVTQKPATNSLDVGDKVKLISGAKYTNGLAIPNWVINKELYVRELRGDHVVFSTLKTGAVTGVADKKYFTEVNVGNYSYMVKVKVDALNIRSGPGTSYKITGTIRDHGVYTIIEEKNGWGKLASGAGYISLSYTEVV
jgi:N-acetylmuramoyl-L-alanine amidase CwlA